MYRGVCVERKLLIGLVVLTVLAMMVGAGARLLAGHRFRTELAEARKEMEAGLLASARKRLTRLAEQRPESADVAYQLGRCEAARGRPRPHWMPGRRIPTDSPWAAPAALEFAEAAIPLGRITEAERVLRTALERPGPEVPALRHLLLVLLGQQGRIDEARHLIEDLWDDPAIVPQLDVADRLAMLREHVGLDLAAFPLEWNLSQLEGGAAATAEDDRRAMGLARAYLATRSGDFHRAEGALRSCLERWPDDPLVWKAWLDWAVAAGRLEQARGRSGSCRSVCWTPPGFWSFVPGSPASSVTPAPSSRSWRSCSRSSRVASRRSRAWPSCTRRPAIRDVPRS